MTVICCRQVDNTKLVSWYKAHYSANLMHVAVFTALPTSDVKDLIVEKFKRVENRHYSRLKVVRPSMREDLVRKVCHHETCTMHIPANS